MIVDPVKTFLLMLAACLPVCFRADATAAGEERVYREITVHVVDEDEVAVQGIEVCLIGLGRGPMGAQNNLTNDPKAKGWMFKTDADGNCRVRFGKFDYWEHEKASGIAEPGYGAYHLLVEKEDYAGGVSPRIQNLNDNDLKAYTERKLGASGPRVGEEWDYTEEVLTDDPKDPGPVEIVLRRGFDVSGQLTDPKGRPMRGKQITLWNDLHADTHTGRGGEIFTQTDKTDKAGRFRFHHVYPNMFYLALEGQDDDRLFWLKTRVRQRWVDGIADAIWPHAGDVKLPLVIVASRESPFRYFGKVTDEKGRPIRGATVRIQASLHGREGRSDFDDDHGHHSHAVTHKDGTYDVRAAGPYVNDFEITAPGFQEKSYSEDGEIYGFDRHEGAVCAPGRYDFTLTRK